MTISALPTRVSYEGTPAGTNGPFGLVAGSAPIPVMDATEIVAVKYPAAGGRIVLSQTGSPPDFLVSLTPITIGGVVYQSASVTTVVALVTGDTLVLERQTALQQAYSPLNGGPRQYVSWEAAWDRLTKIAQEQGDQLGRAVLASDFWDGVTTSGLARMDAQGLRLGNLSPAVNADEAVTLAQLLTGGVGQSASALATTVQNITPTAFSPLTIDLSQGYYIILHLTATPTSLSFINWNASEATKVTMEIRQGGGYSLPLPACARPAGGVAPTITPTAGAIDEFVFLSADAGITVLCAAVQAY